MFCIVSAIVLPPRGADKDRGVGVGRTLTGEEATPSAPTTLMPSLLNRLMPSLLNRLMPSLLNQLMPILLNRLDLSMGGR